MGTSFAAAAVACDGALDMMRLGGQAIVTPSAVYLDEDGQLVTGEAADRLGLQDSSRVAREFKRRLGDPTPVVLGGTPHSPSALMAALLHSIVERVTQTRGALPDHIVLTHPAVWGPYRREQFAAIPPLAGLPRPVSPHTDPVPPVSGEPTIHTVTEPVAAATYYCSTHPLPRDGLLAVYDLGGGTFDSAVVRNGDDGLEIVGTPEGIEWLGGADFDQAILDHVNRQLGGAIDKLDHVDRDAAALLAAVQRECVLAKEALSTRSQADVTVSLPDGDRHVTITRELFERTITPSLDATVEAFRRTLTTAGITPRDLTAILLVGGSSQIPRVAEVLRDTLRRPILLNTHPKHAVALGAAMRAADTITARIAPPGRRTVIGVMPPANPPKGATAGAEASPAEAEATTTGAEASPAKADPATAETGSGTDTPIATTTTAGLSAPPALASEPTGAPSDVRRQVPTTRGPIRRRLPSRYLLLPTIVGLAALLGASFLIAPMLRPGQTPVCGTADIARYQPATASSTAGMDYAAANAVDSNATSHWSSTTGDPQWLQIDLGRQVDVCGVSIQWASTFATAYQIQMSVDGRTWTDVYSTTTGDGGKQRFAVSGTGRYVRVLGTAHANGSGYSISDLAVHTNGAPVNPNIALPGTTHSASASPTRPVPTTAKSTASDRKAQGQATRNTAPTGSAEVPAGSTSGIRSVATGLCVDSNTEPVVTLNGTPMGGQAFAAACTSAVSQKWREGPPLSEDTAPGADWYRLLNQMTGFCFDSDGNGLVYTLPCLNPNPHQLWQRVTNPRPASGSIRSGTVVAYRNLQTGRCISLASDKKVETLPCPSGNSWPTSMLFWR
ncbi:Hsp70 family protein [Micromonospora polyrhachis]|nr:Hsp70 family protein [Micromonospora polyrhachis]